VAAARLFAAPRVTAENAADGSVLLRSADPLGEYPATVIHSLRAWADAAPDPLVAERAPDGGWRRCSYGAAAAAADAIGQALLERGLGPGRPLLVLSGNSVDHHLVTLGALTAGVPIAPVGVAYSLQSQDHARIRAIAGLIRPGAVFAEDAARFGAALDAVAAGGAAGGRRYEIRARGPMVTPGYFGRPDLTSAAVDEQGFYRSGDAVSLADPGDPDAGLVFRGRIAEDFKLATGTFVRVGALRTALLSAAPILSDAVITGEERPWVGALAWLNLAEARRQLGAEPQPQGELVADGAVRTVLAQALAGHNATAGSAARVGRLLVLARAADLDAGEITDKGYVNQRRVLARRAALVELLYAEPAPAGVIVADPSA
jgi:long-subunit acyl-CoA synthetase (AMP-forming)